MWSCITSVLRWPILVDAQTEEELRSLRVAVSAIFLRLPTDSQAAVLNDLKVEMSLAAERARDPETVDRRDAFRSYCVIEQAYGMLRAAHLK